MIEGVIYFKTIPIVSSRCRGIAITIGIAAVGIVSQRRKYSRRVYGKIGAITCNGVTTAHRNFDDHIGAHAKS